MNKICMDSDWTMPRRAITRVLTPLARADEVIE
jgi:hypothetical protein